MKNNVLNTQKVSKFKSKIERSLNANKNNNDFVSIINLYFDNLEVKFVNQCSLNQSQKENIGFLDKNSSSNEISNLIVSYYEFILDNADDIIKKICDFKDSDKFVNKKGNFYLACIFGDYRDLINDFFYIYSNFLQPRSKKYKDNDDGICSICGNNGITYPPFTYFSLDNGSFNSNPEIKNSKWKLCKNCSSFIKYGEDKLFKIIHNPNLLIIPKLKYGSYNEFLKISNKEINSFEKINEVLKKCDNFNFDLLINKC